MFQHFRSALHFHDHPLFVVSSVPTIHSTTCNILCTACTKSAGWCGSFLLPIPHGPALAVGGTTMNMKESDASLEIR